MPKKIVAGNWKMNPLPEDAVRLVDDLQNGASQIPDNVEAWIAPPSLYLDHCLQHLKGHFSCGAQNCHTKGTGAYTGEISADMLAEMGARFVLIGHSERRAYFNESSEFLGEKLMAAQAASITAVLCCGETIEERNAGEHKTTVSDQLKEVLSSDVNPEALVVAYEPVWAIGTGHTATPEQAQEMHAFIREELKSIFGAAGADISLLYGGSCKPSNAKELFAQLDIDGGLIGGASLTAADFFGIIQSF